MKLNLIFIIMDFLTILVFPIVFLHGKLYRLLKLKENIAPVNLLLPVPVAADR